MTRFIFHPQARLELDNAIAWYNAQSQGLDERFLQAIDKALSDIAQYPLAHPKVRNRWRRVLLHNFPYGIIYRPVGETIYVLSCLHNSRNPKHWQKRL